MPGGWSKQHDFIKLADSQTELEYSIPVGELPGLGDNVAAGSQPLQTRLTFGRQQGMPVVDIAVRGAVRLQCQRCMRDFEQPLDLQSRVVLLLTEQDADRAPPSLETILATEGRVSAAALVSEEVLLAIPLAPRHEDEAQCAEEPGTAVAAPAREIAGSTGTRRPFADLQALLDKGRA
jgi:uncharacterized protein